MIDIEGRELREYAQEAYARTPVLQCYWGGFNHEDGWIDVPILRAGDDKKPYDIGLFFEGFCPEHRCELIKCDYAKCVIRDTPVCPKCAANGQWSHWRIKPVPQTQPLELVGSDADS